MPAEKKHKVLDLSGYAFTGKHAVIDLVREFKGYHVPHFAFEFNLIRIQGGIRDLETALVDDWSPIRSDAAIRNFKHLIGRLGSKNSWIKPKSWFSAVGWDYDNYFRGRFFDLSREYVERLIEASWRTDWPYPLADIGGIELFLRKLLRVILRIKKAYDFRIYLSAPEDFLELTRWYLNEVLSSNVGPDIETIVMHNAFEPFNPGRALRYFHIAKSIIVDRDPRDNYVAGLWYRPTARPAEEFVKRYRLCRQIARRSAGDHQGILRLNFEELVLDYEHTLETIFRFLGESPDIHQYKKKYFDPSLSARNIGIWKTYKNQGEIEIIAKELAEFCYPCHG